jgi:hypothetical protein
VQSLAADVAGAKRIGAMSEQHRHEDANHEADGPQSRILCGSNQPKPNDGRHCQLEAREGSVAKVEVACAGQDERQKAGHGGRLERAAALGAAPRIAVDWLEAVRAQVLDFAG